MLSINIKFIIMKKYIYTIAVVAFFITSCTNSTETDHGHEHDENGEHLDHGDHPHNGDEHQDHHQDEFKVGADTLK